MPRPLKSERFELRLSAEEAQLLDEAAAQIGLDRSELVRLLIRNAKFVTVTMPRIGHLVE